MPELIVVHVRSNACLGHALLMNRVGLCTSRAILVVSSECYCRKNDSAQGGASISYTDSSNDILAQVMTRHLPITYSGLLAPGPCGLQY